ncbi:MAG: CBS domain-containing protein [Anaerolineae bacterium]
MKVQGVLATKAMGPGVITVRPEQPVREAVALLSEHNIGALVAVDEFEHPVGIVSERDIVREAASNEQVFAAPVSKIMTRNVITGLCQDDLKSVADTMTERRIRHLPVLDEGKLVGMISIGDVLKAQRDAYAGEVDTLQTQILAEGG